MKWNATKQRQQRNKLGYTQSELARLCGSTQSTIKTIETKGCQPRVGLAYKVAKCLKKDIEYFLDI